MEIDQWRQSWGSATQLTLAGLRHPIGLLNPHPLRLSLQSFLQRMSQVIGWHRLQIQSHMAAAVASQLIGVHARDQMMGPEERKTLVDKAYYSMYVAERGAVQERNSEGLRGSGIEITNRDASRTRVSSIATRISSEKLFLIDMKPRSI